MVQGSAQIDPRLVAEWWQQWRRDRHSKARQSLIAHYLGLARSIAASVYKLRIDSSVAFEDYQQYGRIGLMEAVDRYDPERGIPFEAYAARRVRGAILNGLGHESELLAQRAFRAAQTRDRVRSAREHSTSQGRLERLVGVTLTLAIGAILDGDFDGPVDESMMGNPYAAAELAQLATRVWQLVEALGERERGVLLRHYRDGMEFQDIAVQFGVSKGRISQLHAQALGRIRDVLRAGSSQIRGAF